MALLGLCELALSLLVIHAMLHAPGVIPMPLGHISLSTSDTAARDTAGLARPASVHGCAHCGGYRPLSTGDLNRAATAAVTCDRRGPFANMRNWS